MPFCSQCGKQVLGADRYCGNCGARQAAAPSTRQDPFAGVSPRAAAVLCYLPVVGWIASIIVLASERFRALRAARFHAFQGLYLFVAWLIVKEVLGPMLHAAGGGIYRADKLLQAALFVVSIFMMVKASHDEEYSLPIVGELAQRSIAER